jgi:hypothetical protein
VRPAQQPTVDLGQGQVADLAHLDQFGDRPDGLLDLHVLGRVVSVVQVDHLDAQPQQRGVAGAQHVVPGTADAACRVAGAVRWAELDLWLLSSPG